MFKQKGRKGPTFDGVVGSSPETRLPRSDCHLTPRPLGVLTGLPSGGNPGGDTCPAMPVLRTHALL